MTDADLISWRNSALRFEQQINQTVIGLETAVRQIVVAVFARGHVLLEGNVGVGKTTLLRAVAQGLGGGFQRIEGAIDLMPSDLIYYWPQADLRRLLGALEGHDVVPLVLWDSNEYARLPMWGIVGLRDMEEGLRRALFMRPALRQKIIAAYAERRQALGRLFRAFGSEPLFIESCDIPFINRHLQQRAA